MATKSQSAKPKKCKVCPNTFTPWSSTQVVCSPDCARTKAEQDRIKKEAKEATRKRVETRKAKEAIKTRSDWMKEAQQVFNKFIRLRDAGENCISCGRDKDWNCQWHASHYYATSIRPNLRFNEDNVHKACVICNNYMHGNLLPYRDGLIAKIGIDRVIALDTDSSPAKYSIQDLKDLKELYARKIREFKY